MCRFSAVPAASRDEMLPLEAWIELHQMQEVMEVHTKYSQDDLELTALEL